MTVSYHNTTRRYNPEELDMNPCRRENLKALKESYKKEVLRIRNFVFKEPYLFL